MLPRGSGPGLPRKAWLITVREPLRIAGHELPSAASPTRASTGGAFASVHVLCARLRAVLPRLSSPRLSSTECLPQRGR